MNETPTIPIEQGMPSTGPNQAGPGVRVIRYQASERVLVQEFADVLIDGWLRLNGVNLMRDGSVRPGQLTPLIAGRRCRIDSIQVIDENLRKVLSDAIWLRAHKKLPVRSRPRRKQAAPGSS
jgi:hypothetical protein